MFTSLSSHLFSPSPFPIPSSPSSLSPSHLLPLFSPLPPPTLLPQCVTATATRRSVSSMQLCMRPQVVSVEVSASTACTTLQDDSVRSVHHSSILTPLKHKQILTSVLVSCLCGCVGVWVGFLLCGREGETDREKEIALLHNKLCCVRLCHSVAPHHCALAPQSADASSLV